MYTYYSAYKTFVHYIGLVTVLAILASCGSRNNIYESQKSVPNFTWNYDHKPTFEVSIKDTQARYNMYAIIRHNNNYPFSNIWVILHTITPSGEKKRNRAEFALAQKDGKWYGAGLGGIWEVRAPIREAFAFSEKGRYQFKLEQHMRKNPLPAIMNVGLRIEKIPKKLTLKK